MISAGKSIQVSLLCAAIAGCATAPHDLPPPTSHPSILVNVSGTSTASFVGIAFSGGGSRSATFSAAVLRELAAIDISEAGKPASSILERTRYLSSVSGGSFAAAFYAIRKPAANIPMIQDGKLSPAYDDFFTKEYLPAMQENWEGPLMRTAIGDAIPRANAIAARWDEKVFYGKTFSDLKMRETAGDAPTLILNGTSWDAGRRFVFTNLPASDFGFDFFDRVKKILRARGSGDDLESLYPALDREANRFKPLTFEEVNADPSALPVSLAVASSASVPLLIGPVTFSVQDSAGKSHLMHIGDGGMFDNLGIESLSQVMFPPILNHSAKSPRRTVLIVIDASHPFDGGTDVFSQRDSLIDMLEESPSRISDIMEQRANAYQLLLWTTLRTLAPDNVVPGPNQLTVVYLRHTDAYASLAASPPDACLKEATWKEMSAEKVRDRLSKIPTRFKIMNDCDAALLTSSASYVVATNRQRIVDAAMLNRQ